MRMRSILLTLVALSGSALGAFSGLNASPAAAAQVAIVAAENFYGDLARQIGGDHVVVTSILSNPDQDPHLFEADPSTARALAAAKIVIANGADYDPWMEKLLAAAKAPGRIAIDVAALVGRKAGDNPHLWYDPATLSVLAKRLASALTLADPAHGADFARGDADFEASLEPLRRKVATMKGRYAGLPVTASEPVFGYMAGLLGLVMHNENFQLAVMNDTEPSAADVAAFEDDLKNHKVKVMLFNSQADDAAVTRLVQIAKDSGVPVVGVSETEPAATTYQTWMLNQLDALDKALAGRSS